MFLLEDSNTFTRLVHAILRGESHAVVDWADVLSGSSRTVVLQLGDSGSRFTYRRESEVALPVLLGAAVYRLVDGSHVLSSIEPGQRAAVATMQLFRSSYLWSRDTALIYPPVQPGLSGRLLDWLMEPMPETWIFTCVRQDESQLYTGESLECIDATCELRDSVGMFRVRVDGSMVYHALASWRVCESGTTRFQLLKDSAALAGHPLNPYTSGLFPGTVSYWVLLHFRPAGQWGIDEPVTIGLSMSPPVRSAALADMLALYASLCGMTALSASDMMALLLTWGLSAALSYSVMPQSQRVSSSPLLVMDMFARMDPMQRAALVSLLNSSGGGGELLLSPYHCIQGASYPVCEGKLPVHQRRLYEIWMLVRSQMGLSVVPWPELDTSAYPALFNED